MGSLPHVVEDCLGIVQVLSDGSVLRTERVKFPMEVQDDGTAIWKDCVFDTKHDLHLRLYKPRSSAVKDGAPPKLPVVFFLHGGGFCIGSRTWPNCHSCCLRLASALQVLVISPDYRLAPEHRLPAALEDARRSVQWLQGQALLAGSGGADEWLREGIDFGKVFVIGDSSGGNLAHHLAVELRRGSAELAAVRVRGYVLIAPFFGGTERTKSEAEGPPEKYLNLEILDRFWRLSVPNGETSDHPLANPFGPKSPNLNGIGLDPILVLVGGSEVMKDRIEAYYKRMKEMGHDVEYVEFPGEEHGFFVNQPFSLLAQNVLEKLDSFMTKNSLYFFFFFLDFAIILGVVCIVCLVCDIFEVLGYLVKHIIFGNEEWVVGYL